MLLPTDGVRLSYTRPKSYLSCTWLRVCAWSYLPFHLVNLVLSYRQHRLAADSDQDLGSLEQAINNTCIPAKDGADRLGVLAQLGQRLAEQGVPLVLADGLDELDGLQGVARELIGWEGGGGAEYEAMGAEGFYGGRDCMISTMLASSFRLV